MMCCPDCSYLSTYHNKGRSARMLPMHLFCILLQILIGTLPVYTPVLGQTVIVNQDDAKKIARDKGWLIRQESPTRVIELLTITNGIPLYNTTHNANAADTINTDECLPGGSSGLGLTGTGVTLGIWDAAAVRTSHQEFGGRATQIDSPGGTHFHPTHVAGTMIAAGVNASAIGMSPAASLDCYDWSLDVIEMPAAAAAGLRVSNHSYGFVLGWVFGDFNNGGTDQWFWFGDESISTVEDFKFGLYNGFSWGLDNIAWDHPYYLICRSAGNDRDDVGPPPGTEHLVLINNQWQGSIATRDPDGDYDSLGPRAVAKNVLIVGAVDDIVGGYSGSAGVSMTAYSSWGPTDDGRIKPDIVGNGVNLFSPTDTADIDYTTLSGTSMSTPNVSGSLGVLIQHWRNTHPTETDMRSATLKGLVLHTADEAGTANGPDYQHGWGLMNTLAAANAITSDVSLPLTISEWDLLANGDSVEFQVTTDGTSSELRATICWTDPAGTPPGNLLDPPTKMLVNDLDLRIERPSSGTTYLPWVMNPAIPSAAATTGDNITDNVEQVVVNTPGTDSFVLRVTHKGTLSGGSQSFSIILTGAAQASACQGLTANAGLDTDLCLQTSTSTSVGGSPTACGGTPPYSYLWTGAGAAYLNSTTTANPVFDAVAAGGGTHPLCVQVTDANTAVSSDCANITVASSELAVTVELASVIDTGLPDPSSLTRCITFELFDCLGLSTVISSEITFTVQSGMPTIGTATLTVPCNIYTCITAQDPLHTLRRTDVDNFGTRPIIGLQYVADFSDRTGIGGDNDALLGGDLNTDGFVDILDYVMFLNRIGTNYGTGNTTCATASPHADLSGNGKVEIEEFTFIQINFLSGSELNCCDTGRAIGGRGPRSPPIFVRK